MEKVHQIPKSLQFNSLQKLTQCVCMCLCLCIDHSSCSKESHNYHFPDRHCCKDSTCTGHDKCLVPPNHPSNKLVRFDSGDSTCKMSTWHVIFLQEAMLKLWAPLSSRALLQAFAVQVFCFRQFSLLVERIAQVVDAAQRIWVIVAKLGAASASNNKAGLPTEWCIQNELLPRTKWNPTVTGIKSLIRRLVQADLVRWDPGDSRGILCRASLLH